jgi:hypothetical protein
MQGEADRKNGVRCALCHGPGPLRKSHVLPDFLYRSMYDQKHRFHVLSAAADVKDKLEQTGLWERLLCDTCEGKFAVWERYGQRLLEGGEPFTAHRTGDVVRLSGITYNAFRLFQLSILWRAGVSSLSFFSKVDLGAHSERLRVMLLNEDPGRHLRYGCVMFGLRFQRSVMNGLIVQPGPQRLNGHQAYRFVFGGFVWVYAVSSHDMTGPIVDAILSRKGEMHFVIRDAEEMRDLNDFMERRKHLSRW